jgi:hypothetical protein
MNRLCILMRISSEGKMSISPYYLLIGLGVGFLFVLLLRNLRLFLQFLLTLAKALLVAFLILLIGWVVGLWRLPQPIAWLFSEIREFWRPLQRAVMEWIFGPLY